MTDHLIRNNLRKKELVVIESKQKLQSFVLTHPHSIFLLLTSYFLRKVSMNYSIRFQKVFVMPKIYVLGLCDHIQFKIVTIMHGLHCCTGIADQFNLALFAFHFTCQNLKQEFILKVAL